jgi:excisionase family DNA binding protein
MRLPAAPAYTGLSLRTLRRLIERGELRAYKVVGTRAVMVDTDDLDSLMVPVK